MFSIGFTKTLERESGKEWHSIAPSCIIISIAQWNKLLCWFSVFDELFHEKEGDEK